MLEVTRRYADAMRQANGHVNETIVRNYEDAYLAILRKAGKIPDWNRAAWYKHTPSPNAIRARWEIRSAERAQKFQLNFASTRQACVDALKPGPTRTRAILNTDPKRAAGRWEDATRTRGDRYLTRWLTRIARLDSSP